MSFLSEAFLLERYGLRLNMEQLAQVLGVKTKTLRNQASAGTLKIPTYLDHGGRFADYRDVATYLDSMRATTQV